MGLEGMEMKWEGKGGVVWEGVGSARGVKNTSLNCF